MVAIIVLKYFVLYCFGCCWHYFPGVGNTVTVMNTGIIGSVMIVSAMGVDREWCCTSNLPACTGETTHF